MLLACHEANGFTYGSGVCPGPTLSTQIMHTEIGGRVQYTLQGFRTGTTEKLVKPSLQSLYENVGVH